MMLIGLAGTLTDDLISLFSHATLNIGEFAVDVDNQLSLHLSKPIKPLYKLNM